MTMFAIALADGQSECALYFKEGEDALGVVKQLLVDLGNHLDELEEISNLDTFKTRYFDESGWQIEVKPCPSAS